MIWQTNVPFASTLSVGARTRVPDGFVRHDCGLCEISEVDWILVLDFGSQIGFGCGDEVRRKVTHDAVVGIVECR